MNLSLVKLGCGTTEYGVGFALVVALAVTVEEGDIANTGPAIFNNCGGMELGHSGMVLVFFAKLEITADILCWNNIKSSFLSQD